MMKYTFAFSGDVTVEAESEEEAYALAEELVAPTIWAADNCESITVDEIDLIDTSEED